jgi:DNA-binding NarL/FixJ family response regulator
MSKVRVLLAEDHETVREGLKMLVNAQSDMEVVGEAADGVAAVTLAKELRPDVVVMDVSMPRLSGVAATEAIVRACTGVKVLALTRHTDDAYLQQLLRAGAAGYVLKQSPVAELLRGIRTVIAGGSYLDPEIAGKVMHGFVGRTSGPAPEQPAATNLSPRETEVLRLIAWGHSNKDIATKLELSVKTVETHKSNAMHKLGMTSRIEVVRFAIQHGWLTES